MRCGRCRASVTLGSAHCERCGASLLEAAAPTLPIPAPVPPAPRSPAPGAPGPASAPPPPPPPPGAARPGYAPPPPAPAGFQPSPLGSARDHRRRDRRGVVAPRAGCGCLIPIVALVLLPVGGAIVAAISAIGGATSSGSGVQDEGPLAIGVPAQGGIGSEDTDRWTLAGREGRFEVAVDGEGDFDAVVEVFDGARSLGRNDDAVGRDPRLVVTLEGGREYVVEVTGFGSSSGDYEIEVTPVGGPPLDGGALTVGQAVTGEVPAARVVRYDFVGTGGQATIMVVGIDGFDPTVTVRTTDGEQLGVDDDSGEEDLASLLQLPIAEGQRVVVEVRGFSEAGGRYTIVVQ